MEIDISLPSTSPSASSGQAQDRQSRPSTGSGLFRDLPAFGGAQRFETTSIQRNLREFESGTHENREEFFTTKDTKYAKVLNILQILFISVKLEKEIYKLYSFIGRHQPLEHFEILDPLEPLFNLVLTHKIRVFYDPFSR